MGDRPVIPLSQGALSATRSGGLERRLSKIDKETAPATAPFLLEINVWSVKAQVAAKDATDGAYLGNLATWWVGRRKLFGGPMPDMIKVPGAGRIGCVTRLLQWCEGDERNF
jgi:hypothetical protein